MSKRKPTDLSASIRQRLLNRARERGEDFQLILNQYAVERFLYRLSRSPYADQFVLKGAMLFAAWKEVSHRPTRERRPPWLRARLRGIHGDGAG